VIAKDAGISKAALAYRWVTYHSILKHEYGDGIIFESSNVKQLVETLNAFDAGPLEKTTAERVEFIWKKVEHEAPLNNFQSYVTIQGMLMNAGH
jgi:aflatoxin B1 aldehyde reductase